MCPTHAFLLNLNIFHIDLCVFILLSTKFVIFKIFNFLFNLDVIDDIYKNDEYWNIGLSEDVYKIIMKNKDRLNSAINYKNDYLLDYFGFKVIFINFIDTIININIYVCIFQNLLQYFLAKSNNNTIERPQHLFMKVAVSIHRNDIDSAIETYNMLSQNLCMFSPVVLQLQPAAKKMHKPIIR